VTILGSSSALPTSERFPTAHLLKANERFFLIDCGEGTQMQLRKYRIRLGKINHIFISHLHGDHTFGLFGLLSTMNLLGRKEPLHIYGPGLLEEMLLDHLKFFQSDFDYDLAFHRIQSRRSALVYEDKNIEVRSLPLIHRIPTCGFLFREKEKERNMIKEKIIEYKIPVREIVKIKKGSDFILPDGSVISNADLTMNPPVPRSYAYCSDTRPNQAILPLIKNVDLLYHESTFLHADEKLAHETYHTTSRQAAEFARQANAGKLLLGHFSSRYKDTSEFESEARETFENAIAVNDGDVFEVD
jgi:ribonuclease Z